jgi:hypothetical protein
LLARAEIAAAPVPDNDIPRAEAYMRRFYAIVKRAHRSTFDVNEVARREVNWWVVHRRLSGQAENEELVQALHELYLALYGVDSPQLQTAAFHRAQAMLYSDRWVREGRQDGSLLLEQVESELVQSYSALREALLVS